MMCPSDKVRPRRQCVDDVQQVQQKWRSDNVRLEPERSGENLAAESLRSEAERGSILNFDASSSFHS